MACPDQRRSDAVSAPDSDPCPDPVAHEAIGCLTAIRAYAAGARKALHNGRTDLADNALALIDAQVVRAYELLSAVRRPGSGQGGA